MRPKTASGVSSIAHCTTVIEIDISESRSRKNGAAFSGRIWVAATPASKASSTTASRSPSITEAAGLVGRTPTTRSGNFLKSNALMSGAEGSDIATGISIPSPGLKNCARVNPIHAATAVVTIMNKPSRVPTFRIVSLEGAPAMPPTIEANTRGTRTMAMRPRNSFPGSANQEPRVVAVATGTSPPVGPRRTPTRTPRKIAITTGAHRRDRTQRRSFVLCR